MKKQEASRQSTALDWDSRGLSQVTEAGTVYNPVIDQLNKEDGQITSLHQEWEN